MPYDEALAQRIQQKVAAWPGVDRKKMFGGICHLLDGNMFCGVYKEFLILRLGPTAAEKAMTVTGVSACDITGRPMKGWVMVSPEAYRSDASLEQWLEQTRHFAAGLPPKRKSTT